MIIPIVHFQEPVSRLIVAIVAIHGVYNKQKIINAYAFKLPNPAAVSAAVFFDGAHGRFDVSRIVERVKDADDAHAVFQRFFHHLLHEVVRVIAVTEQVLPAQKHLDGRLFQVFAQRAQALPRVLVEVAHTGIERRAAPALQGIIPHIVELFEDGDHLFRPHARRRLRLVRVAQNGIHDHYFCHTILLI